MHAPEHGGLDSKPMGALRRAVHQLTGPQTHRLRVSCGGALCIHNSGEYYRRKGKRPTNWPTSEESQGSIDGRCPGQGVRVLAWPTAQKSASHSSHKQPRGRRGWRGLRRSREGDGRRNGGSEELSTAEHGRARQSTQHAAHSRARSMASRTWTHSVASCGCRLHVARRSTDTPPPQDASRAPPIPWLRVGLHFRAPMAGLFLTPYRFENPVRGLCRRLSGISHVVVSPVALSLG